MAPVVNLSVYGPGLLGAAVAQAARHFGLAKKITVYGRNPEKVAHIVDQGWADVGTTDPVKAAEGADFIVLATPVGTMGPLAHHIATVRPPSADLIGGPPVVTDVGSVKLCVQLSIEPALRGSGWEFLGSHPMTGDSTSGARPNDHFLFQKRACFVMEAAAHDAAAQQAQARIESFWRGMGSHIIHTTPEAHDPWVAAISHLPRVAATLVTTAALKDQEHLASAAAGGFRDTTRVASGSPTLWREILMENREALIPLLQRFQAECGQLLDFLENRDDKGIESILAEGARLKEIAVQYASQSSLAKDAD